MTTEKSILLFGVQEEAAVPFYFINKGYLTVLNPEHPKHSGPRNEIASYTQVIYQNLLPFANLLPDLLAWFCLNTMSASYSL